jgi:glycosyltransferase involved in cell wall biosynthesis
MNAIPDAPIAPTVAPAIVSAASDAARADLLGEGPEVLLAILTDLSIDHRCHKWARALREAGYHPVIYCDRPHHPLGAAWDGFDVRVLTRDSHLKRFFPVFAEFLFRLTPVLWRTRAKVWISLDAPPFFWLALWGKLRGRTVVYDSHELYLETPLVLNRPSRRLFWTLWENGGFALTRRAITVSPAIIDRLRTRHPHLQYYLLPNMPYLRTGPHTFLPPIAPPPALSASPGAPAVHLVFQGGLRMATGLPELFTALATRPALRATTLDIYGGGPEEASLRAAAHAAGIEARVHFHGSVPFESLPEKMARAHIGIHLMQPVCGSFALTWANKTFDYAQVGLPVLLSDNPAHRTLLATHRVGVAVDSFSPEAIGRGLEELCADYEVFATECRKAREEWHWSAYFRGLPKFLGLQS